MRSLYFEIDGTLLVQGTREPKSALAAGRLDSAVRRANCDELVCVSNFVAVVHTVQEMKPRHDGLGRSSPFARVSFGTGGGFERSPDSRAIPRIEHLRSRRRLTGGTWTILRATTCTGLSWMLCSGRRVVAGSWFRAVRGMDPT